MINQLMISEAFCLNLASLLLLGIYLVFRGKIALIQTKAEFKKTQEKLDNYQYQQQEQINNLTNKLKEQEQKKIELEIVLKETNEKFRAIFQQNSIGIVRVDKQGNFIEVNPGACAIWGYSQEELLNLRFQDITHPKDSEIDRQLMTKLWEGSCQNFVKEKRYIRKDGSIMWGQVSVYPIEDQTGNIKHFIGIIIDISRTVTLAEQKCQQAKIALKESEERLSRIIMIISDGLLIVDQKGNIRFVNQAAETLFKRSQAQLLNHPLGLPILTNEPTEICIPNLQGKLIITEMRTIDIPWEQESAYLVSLRNITEKYQVEQDLIKSEEKYRQIVETTTEGIWMIDRENKTIFVNQQMAQMLGYTVEEMMGMNLLEFMDEEQKLVAYKNLQRRKKGIQETHDFKFLRHDGTDLWAIVSTNPLLDFQGNYIGSLGLITDITERKKIEQALHDSEQRLEGILRSIQDVVWSADPITFKTVYINPAAQIIYGYSLEELYQDSNLWFNMIHPDDQELMRHHVDSLFEKGYTELEYRIIRGDGQLRWLYSRSRIVYDNNSQPMRIDGIDSDITERKQAEEQLRYNATHDALTNLPNRILFMDRLEQAIERHQRRPDSLFAVLFLDLDEFKVVNDSLGHSIGDKLLKEIAIRLQNCLTSDNTLARLGGDEFIILLEEISDIKDAIKIAQRIHQDLTIPFSLEEQEVFTNTSIGIALSCSNYENGAEILRDADTAMYRAKAEGKACYAIFDQQMHARVVTRLQLETDLRRAIERQEFQLYYQPIISLKTGQLTSFEALIRWIHPQRGLVSPAHFIPIAEETGLIIPMGEWILEEACQQLKVWQTQFSNYSNLKMSVNLSGKQLRVANLIEIIDTILSKTKLDNHSLKLEITESILMENVQVATKFLTALRERNIEICLDDFGTGYSSLSYLHRFPVNTLKIDRSFVMRMKPNDENAEIVRAIVSLAHILGLDIIAEGIETELQLTQLKALGCEQGQGYYLARPLTKLDAEQLLKQSLIWEIGNTSTTLSPYVD